MTDLTDKIGRTGCEIRYDWGEGYGYDKAPHAMLQRAVDGPLAGVGYLNVGGKRREFGVICVKIPKPIYVIHPKDAGWVIKRVQALMSIKPAWARPTRKIPLDKKGGDLSRFTEIPDWVDWVDTRWICQQCLPKESADWNPKQCDPGCTVSTASRNRQFRYSYDNRIMHPWTEKVFDARGSRVGTECERFHPGPRDPSAPVLCIPAIIPHTPGCEDHKATGRMERYWADFWGSVGDAIIEYNRRNPVRDDAENGDPSRPKPPPAPDPPTSESKSAWNTPLVLSLVAIGIAGTLVYASRGDQ